MKKINVNGVECVWRFLLISYEDVSKLAYEGIVMTGLTCVYDVPGELGGSLRAGEKVVCKERMNFTIVYAAN